MIILKKKKILLLLHIKPPVAVRWLQNKIQIPEFSIQSHSQCTPNGLSLTPHRLLPRVHPWNQPCIFHTLVSPETCLWYSQNFHVSRRMQMFILLMRTGKSLPLRSNVTASVTFLEVINCPVPRVPTAPSLSIL